MRRHLDGDRRWLAELLAAAPGSRARGQAQRQANGVRVRYIAGQRLGDRGLQFGRAVTVEQPGQGWGDGTEVGATLSRSDQQVRGGRHRLRQAVCGTMPVRGALLLEQGLDVGSVLDLRAPRRRTKQRFVAWPMERPCVSD
jgi:hypothetical protein